MKRGISSILLAVALGIGSPVVGATAAHADDTGTMPAGCTISPVTPSLSGSSVKYAGSGKCSATINSFNIRLVHDYDNLPDVRVKTKSQSYTAAPNFSLSDTTCDGGGSTKYYTEAGYYRSANYGGDVIRSSAKKTLTHC